MVGSQQRRLRRTHRRSPARRRRRLGPHSSASQPGGARQACRAQRGALQIAPLSLDSLAIRRSFSHLPDRLLSGGNRAADRVNCAAGAAAAGLLARCFAARHHGINQEFGCGRCAASLGGAGGPARRSSQRESQFLVVNGSRRTQRLNAVPAKVTGVALRLPPAIVAVNGCRRRTTAGPRSCAPVRCRDPARCADATYGALGLPVRPGCRPAMALPTASPASSGLEWNRAA